MYIYISIYCILYISVEYIYLSLGRTTGFGQGASVPVRPCIKPALLSGVTHRRLLRGGRLIMMAGTERMEWHQTHGHHGNYVFDTIPPILLQPLPRVHPPQLRCHQPPAVPLSLSQSVITSVVVRAPVVFLRGTGVLSAGLRDHTVRAVNL